MWRTQRQLATLRPSCSLQDIGYRTLVAILRFRLNMGAGSSSELPMSQTDFESYAGKRYTVEVPDTRDATHGPAYTVPDEQPINEDEMTLYHNFLIGCNIENGERPLYGRRAIDPETGKAGAYEWLTYNQVKTRMERVASGLKAVGHMKRQDLVGVFSKNQLEWCVVAHACDRMSYVLVPLYDTLGPDAVPFIVNHTELRVLFCGKKQFDVVMACVADCPTLKIVIQFEPVTEEQLQQAKEKKWSSEVYTNWSYWAKQSHNLLTLHYPQMCQHSATLQELQEIQRESSCCRGTTPHVFERAVLGFLQAHGASAGFYQGDLLLLMDDLAELQPTVFVSVPRLFNRVYDKITQGVAAAGGLKKILFDRALAAKLAGLPDGHKTHALWDGLVFSKVRMALGGRVRLIFSGSAPLSAEVKEFLKVVFCCDVAEGYGLSETAAAVAVGAVDMPMGAHVGAPLMYGQVQLEDVPEMGYTSQDRPRPRGEICVRGPTVFAGTTRSLRRLERRSMNVDGSTQATLAAGMLTSKYVAQLFAYGDSLQSCLVGVLVPDPEVAEAWAKDHGLSGAGATSAKVVTNSEFQKAVLADMARVAKQAQLRGFELVKNIHFHPEPFSLEQGLITPTFKLKRPQLKAFFQQQIDKLYEGIKGAQSAQRHLQAFDPSSFGAVGGFQTSKTQPDTVSNLKEEIAHQDAYKKRLRYMHERLEQQQQLRELHDKRAGFKRSALPVLESYRDELASRLVITQRRNDADRRRDELLRFIGTQANGSKVTSRSLTSASAAITRERVPGKIQRRDSYNILVDDADDNRRETLFAVYEGQYARVLRETGEVDLNVVLDRFQSYRESTARLREIEAELRTESTRLTREQQAHNAMVSRLRVSGPGDITERRQRLRDRLEGALHTQQLEKSQARERMNTQLKAFVFVQQGVLHIVELLLCLEDRPGMVLPGQVLAIARTVMGGSHPAESALKSVAPALQTLLHIARDIGRRGLQREWLKLPAIDYSVPQVARLEQFEFDLNQKTKICVTKEAKSISDAESDEEQRDAIVMRRAIKKQEKETLRQAETILRQTCDARRLLQTQQLHQQRKLQQIQEQSDVEIVAAHFREQRRIEKLEHRFTNGNALPTGHRRGTIGSYNANVSAAQSPRRKLN
ncbi:AMP-dependent synthetase/ligase [Phytophthora cactorum]|nr:AMP-dependent synthetase/ligase [Phytophthora cactorum]